VVGSRDNRYLWVLVREPLLKDPATGELHSTSLSYDHYTKLIQSLDERYRYTDRADADNRPLLDRMVLTPTDREIYQQLQLNKLKLAKHSPEDPPKPDSKIWPLREQTPADSAEDTWKGFLNMLRGR